MVSMAIAGVGMVMVSLTRRFKHDNEPRSPLFVTVISSASVSNSHLKNQETVKLIKRLKDKFQLFQLVCFFPLPLLV